jgi:hypothetical protein
MDKQREAFEAAMAAAGYELNPPIYRDGTYRFAHYAAGWEMWQAATAAERERCAKVCEEHFDGSSYQIRPRLAAAIRAG